MFSRFPLSLRCFSAAAVSLAVIAASAPAPAADQTAALERTRAEIAAIRKRLTAAKGQAAAIEREIRALDSQIGLLSRQIRTGEHDISALESDIRTAEANIAELEERFRKALRASNDRARLLYKRGPAESISRLLEARSIGEFIRLSLWWEVTAELDGKAMVDAARFRADLSERRDDLAQIRSDLERQREWLFARRQLVASARGERSRALGGVQAQIAAEERHIRALEQESRRITAAIRAQLSRSTGAVSRSGFIWPLVGRVTSGYGYRRGGFHTGIDIDGNTGDPIKASKAGTIAGIACGSGYGICTIIDHGNGVATLYAHMSRKAVGGGFVGQGQVIGYVGCTGSCTGSHLHFEVRVNGSPQNPMNFLP